MAAFSWQALDQKGRIQKGVWEADSPRHLRQRLRSDGLNPVSMEEVRGNRSALSGTTTSREKKRSAVDRRLNPTDLSMFTRQLATLLRSRLPVEKALGVLSSQSNKRWQQHLFTALRSRVTEGSSLADAFRQFPQAFPEYYAATAEAGEQSGSLEIVLERLADYAEEANATRQKVKLALIYPAVVSVVALLVIVGLLVFVVPKMVETFEHIGQELPLLTRIMISTSDFLQQYGVFLLLGIVLLILLFSTAMKRENFKKRVQRLLLTLPLVSRVIREVNTSRFLRTYGILLSSTVSATQGMMIAAHVLGSLPIRDALMAASRRVREGASIGNSLTNTGYFSPMTLNLVASGEAAGNLPEMLERAGEGQERSLQAMVSSLVGILEPLMIVVMGTVVMLIVLAVLLPIFKMNSMV
ncbi:MAG: type II secretion system inner membrane protein GspF [Pseudomonadota bacterium]